MAALSKEEYLKRYLSPADGGVSSKKKRKKKTSAPLRKQTGMKIVDDDVSWTSFAPKPDEFDEIDDKLLTVDEKPQIAQDVDLRTEEEKKMDEYRRSKMWKKLGGDDASVTSKKKKSKRHDSDSDLDVPRSAHNLQRHDSDSDLEVPRSKKKLKSKYTRHKERHDSDSDLSVERNPKDSDSDPPLRKNKGRSSKKSRHDSDSDLDIPRTKSKKHSSSKHRKRHDSDSDLEVARKPAASSDSNKQGQMGSGGRGGLTSVDLLRLEMEKLKKKESHIETLANQYKDSTTVYRERGSGKKRDLNKEKEDKQEEEEKRRKKEEQYDKWGKGLKQVEMRADAIADTLHESNKSLTRYNDDEDLEAMRKAAVRDGDPMAAYIARKKQKEKGHVQEFPKYKGPAPAPNRYKIMPGYRWDGVDRSNGFERKYFQSLSDNQAYKDEYYKWSVGDM